MPRIYNLKLIDTLMKTDKIATLMVSKMAKNHRNWSVLVNDIKAPKCFIFNSGYWNIIYSSDDNIARNMIENMALKKNNGFYWVLSKYYDMVKVHYDIEWVDHCHLFFLQEKDLDTSNIKHEVQSLRLEDAEIVNEFWAFKSEDSLEYVKNCITKRSSSAVFDDNEKPISWAVIKIDGSIGMLYTREEHRGKGLATSVVKSLARKIINNNEIPFVHIVVGNISSIKLFESIGFKRYEEEVVWFAVKDK